MLRRICGADCRKDGDLLLLEMCSITKSGLEEGAGVRNEFEVKGNFGIKFLIRFVIYIGDINDSIQTCHSRISKVKAYVDVNTPNYTTCNVIRSDVIQINLTQKKQRQP